MRERGWKTYALVMLVAFGLGYWIAWKFLPGRTPWVMGAIATSGTLWVALSGEKWTEAFVLLAIVGVLFLAAYAIDHEFEWLLEFAQSCFVFFVGALGGSIVRNRLK